MLIFWYKFIREMPFRLTQPDADPEPWIDAWLLICLQQMIYHMPKIPGFIDLLADCDSYSALHSFRVRSLTESLVSKYLHLICEIYKNKDTLPSECINDLCKTFNNEKLDIDFVIAQFEQLQSKLKQWGCSHRFLNIMQLKLQ